MCYGLQRAIILPELPSGMEWDTSALYQPTGVLKVIVSTGIKQISDNEMFVCSVFTTSGVKVGNLRTNKQSMRRDVKNLGVPAGIYIVRVGGESVKITVK